MIFTQILMIEDALPSPDNRDFAVLFFIYIVISFRFLIAAINFVWQCVGRRFSWPFGNWHFVKCWQFQAGSNSKR